MTKFKKIALLSMLVVGMFAADQAQAVKIGPRLGVYSESWDGDCLKTREFGLQLLLNIEPSLPRTCSGGRCGGNRGMANSYASEYPDGHTVGDVINNIYTSNGTSSPMTFPYASGSGSSTGGMPAMVLPPMMMPPSPAMSVMSPASLPPTFGAMPAMRYGSL